MIDLHTHTLLSDGALLPSELVQRAADKGYTAIALTDHVDDSNIDRVVREIVMAATVLNKLGTIKVIPGVEITHVPLKGIKDLVKKARDLGSKLVLVHGETLMEPVVTGTNRTAIESGADIVTHPGLILPDDVKLAKDKGVYLEITARAGHSLTNGYVAKVATEIGANLVFSTDSHLPNDLVDDKRRESILLGCGLTKDGVLRVIKNVETIVKKCF
jgi:histidinol phosphatase-like PHP family hydrolase